MTKLWGGRFTKSTHELLEKFSNSIDVDKHLAQYDVLGSIAHARMLGECKIIPKTDALKIVKGLNEILKQIDSGKFKIDFKYEDIHSQIQDVLHKKIGKPALKLHTARSRNDQVCLDTRLYCKDAVDQIAGLILKAQKQLLKLADKNKNVYIPGYTHLQRAQVISFAHHICAYINMLERDKQRLLDARKRVDVCPLGSLALSGSTLPIDRKMTAKLLGFLKVSTNSLDSVSDRDFIIEILSDLSILIMHLSRFAEDLVLWSSTEFGIVDIDESFCTGSSLMPQKKNPDAAELIRGSSGEIYSKLVSVLVMMKGMPLSYNRDMQWDKKPLFEAVDLAKAVVEICAGMAAHIKVNNKTEAVEDQALYATDIAEYLVKKGVAFKNAHEITGKLIRFSQDQGRKIIDLDEKELHKVSEYLDKKIYKLLNADASIKAKISFGSTGLKSVEDQIKMWKKNL